jgi:hypothetical protein
MIDPTPVTIRSISIDRGSRRRENGIFREPALIQENRW